jgi:tRNA (cytosine38-C5)-methyltransferase
MLARIRPFNHDSTLASQMVWRHIPGQGIDWVDPRIGTVEHTPEAPASLKSYLDPEVPMDEKHPYAIPDRVLEKYGRLFDIVLPTSDRTCCFTRGKHVWLLLLACNSIFLIRIYSNGRALRFGVTNEY